jgi:hypothetical protein
MTAASVAFKEIVPRGVAAARTLNGMLRVGRGSWLGEAPSEPWLARRPRLGPTQGLDRTKETHTEKSETGNQSEQG